MAAVLRLTGIGMVKYFKDHLSSRLKRLMEIATTSMKKHKMAYRCVEIAGGWEVFLTKDNVKEYGMLPQTQNPMFVFKMIHCNGNGKVEIGN